MICGSSCLLWDSRDLNVRIYVGPLFRERMIEGASWRPFPRILMDLKEPAPASIIHGRPKMSQI